MFHMIKTIFLKELLDHTRDHRAFISSMTLVVMGPLMIYAMFTLMESQASDERIVTLNVAGGEAAPNLLAYLEQENITINKVDPPTDTIPSFDGADALLVIADNAQQRYAKGQPVMLTLYMDASQRPSQFAGDRVKTKIREFGTQVAQARLIARGMAGSALSPFQIQDHNIAEASGASILIANLALYFFVIVPFAAGMAVSIDVTAGERERQSMQPLLAQPVLPTAAVIGKWLVALCFAGGGMIASLILGWIVIPLAPLAALGVSLQFTVPALLLSILTFLPYAGLAVAAQMFVGLYAKSFKEAQTYVSLLMFVPFIIAFIPIMTGNDASEDQAIFPIANQLEILSTLISQGQFRAGLFLLGMAEIAVIVALLLWAATRRLSSEAMLEQA